ncbi:MAG: hypothetical protein N3A71_00855 [Candidatus Dojkabacteria bacterium]|nr:hypothetical protein [Candidatus Dojkabacteria bacterium]
MRKLFSYQLHKCESTKEVVVVWSEIEEMMNSAYNILKEELGDNLTIVHINEVSKLADGKVEVINEIIDQFNYHVIKIHADYILIIFTDNTTLEILFDPETDDFETLIAEIGREIIYWRFKKKPKISV